MKSLSRYEVVVVPDLVPSSTGTVPTHVRTSYLLAMVHHRVALGRVGDERSPGLVVQFFTSLVAPLGGPG